MSAEQADEVIGALRNAAYRVLTALARVLLRYGIPYSAFEDLARRAFASGEPG